MTVLDTIPLSQEQQQALDFVMAHVATQQDVAVKGFAGTGKSTLIPPLLDRLTILFPPQSVEDAFGSQMRDSVYICAPTNRAAALLRAKGLKQATTYHRICFCPIYDEPYTEALAWVEDMRDDIDREGNLQVRDAIVSGRYEEMPALLQLHKVRALAVFTALGMVEKSLFPSSRVESDSHAATKKILRYFGIDEYDHVIGQEPREHMAQAVIVVDEASMLGRDHLDTIHQVFDHVVLIGDPGQLPPVNDGQVLREIKTAFTLTEIHRQAFGSAILTLAAKARRGVWVWTLPTLTSYAPDVRCQSKVDSSTLHEAPIIVFKNNTRRAYTKAIRTVLGYPADAPIAEEVLICCENSPKRNGRGDFWNNSQYRIDACEDHHALLEDLLTGEMLPALLHIDEIDGEDLWHPRATKFRFGYVLTAHAAQGGQWPRVYIDVGEAQAFMGFCERGGKPDEGKQWVYTALTRAVREVVFVRKPRFTRSAG